MLTVKIVHKGGEDDGIEIIRAAKEVVFQNNSLFLDFGNGAGTSDSWQDYTGSDWRDIFVMNENGATVARYTL